MRTITRIFFISLLGILGLFLFFQRSEKQYHAAFPIKETQSTPTVTPQATITRTLFVPYWSLSSEHIDSSIYDRIIYFGVTVNKQGINTQEDGYNDIDTFLATTSDQKQRLLAVRMITTDTNNAVLADKALQQEIVQQSIALAKEKEFDGIVLDFEISALGFEKITNEITAFENTFADAVKHEHLLFFSTMYGDTFVRFRPFDVKAIAAHDDGVLIMAYDFHKASGSPGPNFPYSKTEDGYDFTTMTDEFLQNVPPQKITVVFGLFGYDWTVDDKGNAITQADSLSDNQIKQKFLDTCPFTDCVTATDPATAETHITYTDSDGKSHIVWFEDMQSIAKKIGVLKEKHVGSVGYWAYSYF